MEILVYDKEQQKYIKICSLLCKIWIVATFLLWFVWWLYGAVALAFGIWSRMWYERGKMSQVVDEWEQDGYPQDGLRYMVRSWILLLMLFAVWVFYFK